MSGAAIDTASARWLRVAKIVFIFVVIGPLVASIVLFASHFIEGLSNARYTISLEAAPRVWWSWLMISFMAGSPYAALTGAAFALLAVFAGASPLVVAIAAGLAPLAIIHWLPPIGEPLWRMGWLFALTAIAVVVVASSVCWMLTRRWHGSMS